MNLVTKTDSKMELSCVPFRIRSIVGYDDKQPPLGWIVAFDVIDVDSWIRFLFATRDQMSVDSLRSVTT